MDLLLTLGHNSSAIGVTSKIGGWEQERLNREKSSSKFPIDAIKLTLGQNGGDRQRIFISHWFDAWDFHNIAATQPGSRLNRYYDPDVISGMRRAGWSFISLSPDCTHHDAHAWSALSFVESHLPAQHDFEAHCIVSDGFGNQQEVISVYHVRRQDDVVAVERLGTIHGYHNSLGLLYQYATSFCGMKENQDEYKFLGYESHIDEVEFNLETVQDMANGLANSILLGNCERNPSQEFINLDQLKDVKENFFYRVLDTVVNACRTTKDFSERDKRIIVGHFIQIVLETVYAKLIENYGMTNVLLAGGVHYNVKLNNAVLKMVPGWVSVVPLAGDQGAAIGLYRANGNKFDFSSLLWGHRSLCPTSDQRDQMRSDDIVYCTDREDYVQNVRALLNHDMIVNTVTGPMEFGPRALCNTSTLAQATVENMDAINALNGRNTVMPFAPVMLQREVETFFDRDQAARVVGSDKFMIVTFDYRDTPTTLEPHYHGVMHKYPRQDVWSGRPQVITPDNPNPIRQILEGIHGRKLLINTSLNVHGMPIVFSLQHALDDMAFNREQAKTQKLPHPILVIGDF